MNKRAYSIFPSPIGNLCIVACDGAICELGLPRDEFRPEQLGLRNDDLPLLRQARSELQDYFAKRRRVFTLPLRAEGTPFQRAVWAAMYAIPYGETRSYGELAKAIGRPAAFRAVGQACGRNPISIIQPCHRVLAANGALGGFRSGLDNKRQLLALEGISLKY